MIRLLVYVWSITHPYTRDITPRADPGPTEDVDGKNTTPASQHVVDMENVRGANTNHRAAIPNEKRAAAVLDVMRAAAAADEVDGSVKR
jgi:hypothetical protein